MSPAEWRYLRITLPGQDEADSPDMMVHSCPDCLVHGSECEELFPSEAAATVGCHPLDFPEPVFV